MTKTDKFELLKDLAHLIKKHGPQAFADLSKFLKNPNAMDELVTILNESATAGRKARGPSATGTRRTTQASLNEFLSEVENADPDKGKLLLHFVRLYRAKRALPTMRSVRNFAADNGLRPISVTSREKALLPLVKDLEARPTSELSALVRAGTIDEREGDRTLEGWTGVILDKERRNR